MGWWCHVVKDRSTLTVVSSLRIKGDEAPYTHPG